MSDNNGIEIYVYGDLEKKQFKYCIYGEPIELNNIIEFLKKITTTTTKKEKCCKENLLYILVVTIPTDSGENDSSGFTFELKLTFENDEVIHISEPIRIAETDKKDFINVNDKETNCDDILSALLNLIALTPKIDKEMDLKKEYENLREKVEPKDDRKL